MPIDMSAIKKKYKELKGKEAGVRSPWTVKTPQEYKVLRYQKEAKKLAKEAKYASSPRGLFKGILKEFALGLTSKPRRYKRENLGRLIQYWQTKR